ncbi:MAG: flagellin B, partial [Gammaproteobacteria bacterium]|nr:flagellin B [Gammaproteobacteria bacterium]
MGFRINTNIAAMNAHTMANVNNRNLDSSLSKLSSGLRINTAADDASGMAIADSLRSQASALGQAIANANDGIGMIQTADKAMDEQIKILDTIKVKATQAAQDGQTTETRRALQADIVRLTEELDNIAGTTSFNGKQLLSGQFSNATFQIGAYSNQTVSATIGATSSDKIGHTRFETYEDIGTGSVTLTFSGVNGDANKTITLEAVTIGSGAGEGLGVLAETINKNSNALGVRASYKASETGSNTVTASASVSFTLNGVTIVASNVQANDNSGALVQAINAEKETTGVTAAVDARGRLALTTSDGRMISVSGLDGVGHIASGNYSGALTLTKVGGVDVRVSGLTAGTTTEETISLRNTLDGFTASEAKAIGAFSDGNAYGYGQTLGAGVTTMAGAMAMMDIADTAIKQLDSIRADLGSVQNQMVATINNISVTQVNVKAAESQIRDVDFAAESANFSKYNILAQSGSYAMSQANAVQQNV